jgi:hypothetical protein
MVFLMIDIFVYRDRRLGRWWTRRILNIKRRPGRRADRSGGVLLYFVEVMVLIVGNVVLAKTGWKWNCDSR